ITFEPAPRVKRISVVAGLSETILVGAAPMRIGSPKSSCAADGARLAFSHAASASGKHKDKRQRREQKNKTDTPLRGMPATNTREKEPDRHQDLAPRIGKSGADESGMLAACRPTADPGR